MKNQKAKNSGIIIYKTPQNEVELKVYFKKENIWLNQNQIALLFGTQRPAVTKHLKNIFQSGELKEKVVSSILEHTTEHGAIKGKTQTKDVKFYNLDAIISVGYRVNSRRATQFRIWATKVLRRYLVKGYVINEKRLLEAKNKFYELQKVVLFLQKKSKTELLKGQETEIFNLLADYSKTLTLLGQYDKRKILLIKKTKGKFILKHDEAKRVIFQIKKDLVAKKEAGNLFGQESGEKFKAILGNIYQTFERKELYSSLEEKAAHLLYFIIKDHPFIDGNKRISSFLFIYFLDKNNYLYGKDSERKINDNALVSLALLIAISDPRDKNILIRIITNFLGK